MATEFKIRIFGDELWFGMSLQDAVVMTPKHLLEHHRRLVSTVEMKRIAAPLGNRLLRMRFQATNAKCKVHALNERGAPPSVVRDRRDVIRNIKRGLR